MSFAVAASFAVHHAPGDTVGLLPREEEFFDLFTQVATRNKEAVEHLRQLFQAAPDRRTPHVEAIKRLEHEADQDTHEVVNRLDRTLDPKSTRLNSSHRCISYAVFCLKKKTK